MARPVLDRVAEGGTLTWRLTLTPAAAIDLYLPLTFLPVDTGPELSTTDLPADWVTSDLRVDPLPERALSQSNGDLGPTVPAGDTEFDVLIPTSTDAVVEGEEHLPVRTTREVAGKETR